MTSPWAPVPSNGPLPLPLPIPPARGGSVPTSGPWARRPGPEAPPPPADEPLEDPAARQKRWASRIVRYDFRGAIRSNGRRTFFVISALTFCAMLVGCLAAFALNRGQIDPVILGAAALGMAAASLTSSAFSLIGADHRVLDGQGAIRVDGTERGDTGRLARRLHNVTAEMALASNMPMPKVFMLDEPGLNAFAVGKNPDVAAVAATRGLVETLTRDELQAVMAHEMAHIAQRDTRLMVVAAATGGIVLLVVDILGSIMRNSDSRRLGAMAGIAFLVAWVVAALVMPILQMALSRQREYMADAHAVKFTRNPAAMASALERIAGNPHVATANHAVAGLYILSPCAPSALDGLMSTHPPVEKRIARILDLRAD